ncbi:MAG: polymer-forming cytoskeletal protein [Ottowia sp.]|nr:polymer-forming cytoskeletal protein [Ottowia sp.]
MSGPFFKRSTIGSVPSDSSTPSPLGGAPAPATGTAPLGAGATGGSAKLTVGANIKLRGVEITDCDTLVVEGTVEASMNSRVIQIAERGEFKGKAEIDIAEVRGTFDGDLTVRQKLVIFATGKVTGKIRYGKIVIEEGGQLSGEISCSGAAAQPAKDAQAAKK